MESKLNELIQLREELIEAQKHYAEVLSAYNLLDEKGKFSPEGHRLWHEYRSTSTKMRKLYWAIRKLENE